MRPRKLDGPPLEEIDSGGGKPCGPAAPDVATKGTPTFRSTPAAKLIVVFRGVVALLIEKRFTFPLKGPSETILPKPEIPMLPLTLLAKRLADAWILGEAVESVPTPNIPDEVMLNGVAFGTKVGNPRVTFTGTVALTVPPFTFRLVLSPTSPVELVLITPRKLLLPASEISTRFLLSLKLKALPVLHILWPLV